MGCEMFNKQKVVYAIRDSVEEGFMLNQDSVTIGTKEDAQLVKWCLETGYIPEAIMRNDVHRHLCLLGRALWKQCIDEEIGPENFLTQETVWYVVGASIITDAQAHQLAALCTLDWKGMYEHIRKSYGLLDKVMQQIKDGTAF